MINDIFDKLYKKRLQEAYVHCHECGWSQDDFWTESFNPVRFLLNWEQDLLEKDLDEQFTNDASFIEENGDISRREVIARACERAAAKIRGMHFMAYPDMSTAKCPQCGHALDVD